MDDNLSSQVDEVEALTSIYGDEWCVLDEASRTYCIKVTDGADKPRYSCNLQVTLPPEYPSSSPPHYTLNAPWLRGEDRFQFSNELEEIYCQNIGESIIYLWVEKLRELIIERSEKSGSDSASSPTGRVVIQSTETDHDYNDDDLDLDVDDLGDLEGAHVHIAPAPREKLECPEIVHGGIITDRKSIFQSHLAPVFYKEQVQLVMEKLLENKKIANATHNIQAYRIYQENPHPVFLQGCEDDGETHAGSRMLHLMKIIDCRNVLVVVTRWYGGIHLGPDRFKHINNSLRQILLDNGYIKDKQEKKKPRSSNKK